MSSLLPLSSALAKNGSFGFAKGWLLCRAKPNVPFVRWHFSVYIGSLFPALSLSFRLAPNSLIPAVFYLFYYKYMLDRRKSAVFYAIYFSPSSYRLEAVSSRYYCRDGFVCLPFGCRIDLIFVKVWPLAF